MKEIKYIKQEDDSGCGLACLAMLTGMSYNEVKKRLKLKIFSKESNEFYTNFHQTIRCAKILGLSLNSRKRNTEWKSIETNAIVSTDYTKGKTKYWHWVVFVRNKNGWFVYDPHETKGRGGKKIRSMRGRKLGWYMTVIKIAPKRGLGN